MNSSASNPDSLNIGSVFQRANCSVVPITTSSDSGVAGPGILLSFIITTAISLILSAIIIFQERYSNSKSKVLRKLLLSYSDKEILLGIGIQSIGLLKIHSLVSYHIWLIWMQAVLATITHLATLLALANDLRRDWVLRWVRQFLMFVNLGLSWALGVFVLQTTTKKLPSTLPVSCVWEKFGTGTLPSDHPGPVGLSVAGTIGVIVGNLLVFGVAIWYLHFRRHLLIVKIVGLLITTAIGGAVIARTIQVSYAFGKPSVPLSDNWEKQWTFGQLLGLLLLLMPLVSAVEMIRGEMNVPPPLDDETYNHLDKPHTSFQPNPFWGKSRFSV